MDKTNSVFVKSIGGKNGAKIKKCFFKGLSVLVAALVAFLILFPIIWIVPSAFKPRGELFALPNHFFPQKATLDNFSAVFQMNLNGYSYVRSLVVTTLVSVAATVLALTVNILAGYAFARIEFRGRNILWIYFIVSMFVPGITIQLTSIKVVSSLGMINTPWVLILPAAANSYQIFFFRQFYLGFPVSVEEAAAIDGCSRFKSFLKIAFPISATPLVVLGIGCFMGNYNSYIWPVLTINDNVNLTQVMQIIKLMESSLVARHGYGVVIAATLISIIIPIGVFAVFQKKIIAGIAITGLK